MAYITFQPSDYFSTKLYTGTGSSNAITGVGFQPDWTWIKRRDNAASHAVQDAVRGNDKSLRTNTSGAEYTNTFFSSFDSDGFTVTSTESDVNASSGTYASWNWKANGSGSTNTDGGISATVSADASRGFSIIQYTGSGSASTVGHGLGAAPDVTIRKKINTTDDWYVHTTLIDGSFDFLRLNTSDAKADSSLTGFTSTTVGVEASSFQEIIYAFKEINGFSKIGTYTGTGNADGPMIYTGFKPAFFLYKLSSASGQNWTIHDNKRIGYNPVGHLLHPDLNNAESNQQSGSLYVSDFLSNGIKLRGTDTNINADNATYIYMAFAENPIVSSNNIPGVAR